MQSSVIDMGSDTGDAYPIDFRIRTMGLLFVVKYRAQACIPTACALRIDSCMATPERRIRQESFPVTLPPPPKNQWAAPKGTG